jgi:hypothetical protein
MEESNEALSQIQQKEPKDNQEQKARPAAENRSLAARYPAPEATNTNSYFSKKQDAATITTHAPRHKVELIMQRVILYSYVDSSSSRQCIQKLNGCRW